MSSPPRRGRAASCGATSLERSCYVGQVTDAQNYAATIAGVFLVLGGAVRWIRRWKEGSRGEPERTGDQATRALIENAQRLAVLSDRVESLGNRGFDVARLETAAASLNALSSQIVRDLLETSRHLERTAEILERDARLDESQRAKLAKIRSKISRGLATSSARSGSSGEDDR